MENPIISPASPLAPERSTPSLAQMLKQVNLQFANSSYPLTKLRHAYESGQAANLSVKAECGILSVIFTEHFWNFAVSLMKQHPLSFLHLLTNDAVNQKLQQSWGSFEGRKLEIAEFVKYKSPTEITFKLEKYTEGHLKNLVYLWYQDLNYAPGQKTLVQLQRYQELLEIRSRDRKEAHHVPRKNPALHIMGGLGHANHLLWETLRIVPIVLNRDLDQLFTVQQLKEVCLEALKIIQAFRMLQLDVFFAIRDRLFKGNGIDPEMFSASQQGDKLLFELNRDIFSDIGSNLTATTDEATGCSAIYAIGPNQRHVSLELQDLIYSISETLYFPYLPSKKN
ncbi:MAG: hypothetical protein R3A13_05560 [Bdellovibrionota bacterium]